MFVASVQSVLGCLIQAFMVGLVFSKLSRPGSRSKTVIFSQNAVVTLRNRRLCLIFRIGDLRDDNFILGTQISAKLVRRRITQEGELYEEMQPLKVDPDSTSEPCIFFVWPLEVVHIIDEDSPFFDLSAAELAKEKFEITVVMEGCIETTSMNFQARTSYLPGEILWGHRFEPMMLYRKDNNKFQAGLLDPSGIVWIRIHLSSASGSGMRIRIHWTLRLLITCTFIKRCCDFLVKTIPF
jgi:potassium inwardly-rectifying channel subfamily J